MPSHDCQLRWHDKSKSLLNVQRHITKVGHQHTTGHSTGHSTAQHITGHQQDTNVTQWVLLDMQRLTREEERQQGTTRSCGLAWDGVCHLAQIYPSGALLPKLLHFTSSMTPWHDISLGTESLVSKCGEPSAGRRATYDIYKSWQLTAHLDALSQSFQDQILNGFGLEKVNLV